MHLYSSGLRSDWSGAAHAYFPENPSLPCAHGIQSENSTPSTSEVMSQKPAEPAPTHCARSQKGSHKLDGLLAGTIHS